MKPNTCDSLDESFAVGRDDEGLVLSHRKRDRLVKPQIRLPIGHAGRGRPHTYDPALAPRARKLALLGMTDVEIADFFGVEPSTLYRWKHEIPEFSEALLEGKAMADAEVAETLFNLAAGRVRQPAVKVFLGEADTPVYAPYVHAVPPNVAAQKLWLLNRQPNRWREKREVEISGGIEHKIAMMTPAERLERLRELQLKASAVIDAEAVEVEPEDG